MTDIIPTVSPPWTVRGALRDAQFPELLNATMVDVFNRSRGILIYGGWEPEEDPTGHYIVGAIHGSKVVAGPYAIRDIRIAAALIEDLAESYSMATQRAAPRHRRKRFSKRPPGKLIDRSSHAVESLSCLGRFMSSAQGEFRRTR